MEIIEAKVVDKNDWPDGKWKNEPDFILWRDRVTGYICFILRNEAYGTVNGYVGIPFTHGGDVEYLDCHGGITYEADKNSFNTSMNNESWRIFPWSSAQEYLNEIVYVIGFDTLHSGDYTPKPNDIGRIFTGEYKDIEYVMEHCRQLCLQLRDYNETT